MYFQGLATPPSTQFKLNPHISEANGLGIDLLMTSCNDYNCNSTDWWPRCIPIITRMDIINDRTVADGILAKNHRKWKTYFDASFNRVSTTMVHTCATGSALVQVMAWCHIGTKPLPEPRLTHLSVRPLRTNITEIWVKIWQYNFIPQILWSAKWQPFCFNPIMTTIDIINGHNAANGNLWRQDCCRKHEG